MIPYVPHTREIFTDEEFFQMFYRYTYSYWYYSEKYDEYLEKARDSKDMEAKKYYVEIAENLNNDIGLMKSNITTMTVLQDSYIESLKHRVDSDILEEDDRIKHTIENLEKLFIPEHENKAIIDTIELLKEKLVFKDHKSILIKIENQAKEDAKSQIIRDKKITTNLNYHSPDVYFKFQSN